VTSFALAVKVALGTASLTAGALTFWHFPQRAEAVAKNRTARARDLTIKEQRAIARRTVTIKSSRHLVMCICREGG